MAVIDFESAWFALKARIQEKRSHGARDLAELMAEIEVECRLDESSAGYDDRPVLGGSDRPERARKVVAESAHGDAADTRAA